MTSSTNCVPSKKLQNFNKWLNDITKDKVFRMWVYKRMFTPYEQQEAFSDQSEFVNEEVFFIKLREAVTLPNGDILIEYTFADGSDSTYMEYAKLSEIKLAYSERDNNDNKETE